VCFASRASECSAARYGEREPERASRKRRQCSRAACLRKSWGHVLPAQIPEHAQELRQLGLQIDPTLLADPKSSLLGAIVNFGCSASFVSKEGLLITNHHCATSALQTNSTPSEDLLKNGILAKTRAEERSSGPSARLNVLSKTTERHGPSPRRAGQDAG